MSTYSAPIAAVKARLLAHVKAAGPLSGFKLTTQPRTESEPVDDLPSIRFQGLAIDETGQTPRAAVAARVTLALEVAVERKGEDALVRLADAVAAVADAIEMTAEEELADGSISQTTINGAGFKTEGSGTSGIALFTVLTVTLETKPAKRGARS